MTQRKLKQKFCTYDVIQKKISLLRKQEIEKVEEQIKAILCNIIFKSCTLQYSAFSFFARFEMLQRQLQSKEITIWQALNFLRQIHNTLHIESRYTETEKETCRFLCDVLLSYFVIGATFYSSLQVIFDRCLEFTKQDNSSLDIAASLDEIRSNILCQIPAMKPHSFFHFICHPKYAFGSLQCRHVYRNHLAKYIKAPFDPKADLHNACGILYSEIRHQEEATLHWNIGPTPTVDIQLAPEAHSFIRLLLSKREEKREFFPYTQWIYINLQNRVNINEKKRVFSLEQELGRHPSTLSIATISVDSPFYKVLYDSSIYSLQKAKTDLQAAVTHVSSYEIGSDSYYYFQLPFFMRFFWEQAVIKVTEKAFSLIIKNVSYRSMVPHTSHHLIQHKMFQELCVYGLCRAWQGWSVAQFTIASEIEEKGEKGIKCILSTLSCREGVDRGGAINGGLIGFLTEKKKNAICKKAFSIMWGRPILFRSRLNEHDRAVGFLSLIKEYGHLYDISQFLEKSFQYGYTARTQITG